MRIAIIQPYFFPYAGYFRLLSMTDLLVVFDCVQFPRRGWVHRNRIQMEPEVYRWLTLPLKKQPRSVAIKDLRFHEKGNDVWKKRLAVLAVFNPKLANPALHAFLNDLKGSPIDYLEKGLQLTCQQLSLPFNVIRSSSLHISAELRGQDRVIEICKRLNATEYLNAPGGRHLYHQADFERHNLSLKFLSSYQGGYQSILQRLFNEKPADLLKELNLAENRAMLSA